MKVLCISNVNFSSEIVGQGGSSLLQCCEEDDYFHFTTGVVITALTLMRWAWISCIVTHTLTWNGRQRRGSNAGSSMVTNGSGIGSELRFSDSFLPDMSSKAADGSISAIR